MNFIRKVYGILSIQLCITATFVTLVKLNDGLNEFMMSAGWLGFLAGITAIIIQMCLVCCVKFSRRVPTNYILMLTFTICQSIFVAYVCSFYEPSLIFLMTVLTGAMTLVITIFACLAESDFTTIHAICPILSVCFLSLIICSFFMVFSSFWEPVYATIMIMIYGIYLVHDTQLIAGDKKYALSYDDYIVGAMMVYVDIIMLFLELLRLFGGKS